MATVPVRESHRNNDGLTLSSTGTDPSGWRAWWREQSRIDGTDWISIASTVSAIMRQLVTNSSSWAGSS